MRLIEKHNRNSCLRNSDYLAVVLGVSYKADCENFNILPELRASFYGTLARGPSPFGALCDRLTAKLAAPAETRDPINVV